jgi:hypothetical protein
MVLLLIAFAIGKVTGAASGAAEQDLSAKGELMLM